jgi:glycosyltransferase involved in cell wall biosynthesis
LSRERPRALMIAPAMPASGGNGLAMRLGLFLEALSRVAETDLVVLPVAGRPDDPPALPARLGVTAHIVPVAGRQDTLFALIARLADPAVRRAAFRAYGRPSLASFVSLPVLAELRTLAAARRYDLVHAGRLYLAEAALAIAADARLSIDLDEDDAAAQRGRAALCRRQGRGAETAWALAEARAFAALGARTLPRFDAAFAASPWRTERVETVPNAVALDRPPRRRDDGRTLLFVGSLGYTPNVDGILWFVERVWPAVRRARPVSRLLIVGGDAPRTVRALDGKAGIDVRGPVPALGPLYAAATLAIAPLRIGGGTRIKLIEAAAHRTPFVATPLAAAGLDLAGGRCGWIADGAAGFAEAVLEALGDPAERRRRADRAHRIVTRRHDRRDVIEALTRRLAALLPGRIDRHDEEPGR